MPPSNLKIIPVEGAADFKRFIKLPYRLYQDDPRWIPPLYRERKETLHPKKNPYYQHATVRLFLALDGDRPVGRISAQIDHQYEKFHGERVGHFGFFESENDPEIAKALLNAAEEFAKKNGARRILGPFSFSINEESGLLIDGFDQPLMIMTPYNPTYYPPFVENNGFTKAKDLYAWWCEGKHLLPEAAQVAEQVSQYPGLKIRKVEKRRLEQELQTIFSIYNSAWEKNWGFIPFLPEEVAKVAQELKLILDPEIALLAEVNGETAGICLGVPNLYEVIGDLKGRLFPFGFAKLLRRIRTKKFRSLRLMLLGVKKEFRGSVLGGLSVLLYTEISRRSYQAGYVGGELGWTLEDNHKINAGIEFMGGKRIKTFRIYEKDL